MRSALIAATCMAGLLLRPAHAQVVSTTVGTSSLSGAHGGTVDVSSHRHGVSFGLGVVRGQLALRARARFRSPTRTISVGDEAIVLSTPTDMFGGDRALALRGASITTSTARTKMTAAAGASAEVFGSPFVQGIRTGRPVFLFSADAAATKYLSLFTRNHVGARTTVIGGVTFSASPKRLVSIGVGLNAGRPYASMGGAFSRGAWLDVKGVYARAGRGVVESPPANRELMIGHEGADMTVTLRHGEHSLEVGHDRAWSIDDVGVQKALAVVDRVDLRTVVGGLSVHAGSYRATRTGARTMGVILNANRTFGPRFEAEIEALGGGDDGWALDTYAVRVRENAHARVSLQQTVSVTDGHVSGSVGGRLLTNPMSIDISHQTTATPAGSRPFVQSLGIDVRVNLFAGIQLHGATYVTPDGRVRHAVSLSHVGSRQNRQLLRARQLVRLGGYLISGRVVDVSDRPVAGAALRVGDDVVISDDGGRFYVRTTRRVTVPFEVLTGQFQCLEMYRVVSAPARVTSDRESVEQPVIIRLAALVTRPSATP